MSFKIDMISQVNALSKIVNLQLSAEIVASSLVFCVFSSTNPLSQCTAYRSISGHQTWVRSSQCQNAVVHCLSVMHSLWFRVYPDISAPEHVIFVNPSAYQLCF